MCECDACIQVCICMFECDACMQVCILHDVCVAVCVNVLHVRKYVYVYVDACVNMTIHESDV